MPEVWTIGEMLVEIMRPRPDMPLRRSGEFIGPFPSGAPAIFIDTVARLGHSAGIAGGVGDDAFGACLLDRLRSDGVDVSHVTRASTGSTAVAFVAYKSDGSRDFIFHIDGTPAVAVNGAPVRDDEARFLHVMGCSLMANDSFRRRIFETVEEMSARNVQVSFDPNIRIELLGDRPLMDIVEPVLRRTSILLPGAAELCLIAGCETAQDALAELFNRFPLQLVVVKHGRRGATVHTRDRAINIHPFTVQEVDPTGAGDCFDAGFLVGLLEDETLERCGQFAAAAGALNAAAFGPMEGDISLESIRRLIAELNP